MSINNAYQQPLINPDNLVARGYQRYLCNKNADGEKQPLYQKSIADDQRGKLYFINFWEYDWTRFDRGFDHNYSFGADVQYNCLGGVVFDVHLHLDPGMTVDGVEEFFAAIYKRMQCIPYDERE